MLSSFILAAANHLLAPAGWARARLQPHAGRTARLALGPLLEVDFSVASDGHLAQWMGDESPDVTLRLSPGDLPSLLAKGSAELMREVRIEGNADFAEALGFVFRNLRWDAEEDFARIFGDLAAHRMVGDGRRIAEQGRLAIDRAGDNLREFMIHEARLLAARDALPILSAELAALRDRLARLEKRVLRVASRRR